MTPRSRPTSRPASRTTRWAAVLAALTLPGSGLLAFSADGERLVGCANGGTLQVWSAAPLPPPQE